MSKWLNTKFILKDNGTWKAFYKGLKKPCLSCGCCPYGQLVEEFPVRKKANKYSCTVFGHDCPIFYHAEPLRED